MIQYLCKNCGESFYRYNTLQRLCGKCSFNTLSRNKPIKKIGAVTKKWIDTRQKWIEEHPSDHAGYWYCYLCGKTLMIDELTLDHVESRSARPDKRFDMTNLRPCCYDCNAKKGSKRSII